MKTKLTLLFNCPHCANSLTGHHTIDLDWLYKVMAVPTENRPPVGPISIQCDDKECGKKSWGYITDMDFTVMTRKEFPGLSGEED